MTHRRLFLASCITGIFVAGCAQGQPYRPVPEMREERIPEMRHGRIWEPGHWHWNGRDYEWIRGHEIEHRPHYRRYVHGEWVRRGHEHVWVGPHWE